MDFEISSVVVLESAFIKGDADWEAVLRIKKKELDEFISIIYMGLSYARESNVNLTLRTFLKEWCAIQERNLSIGE